MATQTTNIDLSRISEKMEKIQKKSVFQEMLKTEPGIAGSKVYIPLPAEKQAIAQSLGRELVELLVLCQRHNKRTYSENKETFEFLYKRWPLLRLGKMDGWHYLSSVYSEGYSDRNEANQMIDFVSFNHWLAKTEAKFAS